MHAIDGAENNLTVYLFLVNTNIRFFRVGDLVPGLGTDLLTYRTADTEFRIIGQDFHIILSLNSDDRLDKITRGLDLVDGVILPYLQGVI